MMDDDQLASILTKRITAAKEQGLSQQDRRLALDYYLTRPRGDEMPGRSTVQSGDVADMIEATLAAVLPSFTGDQVCEFEPDSEGDENQARLESDAVNKVMMEASRGFVVFYEAIKDALTLRNGIIKVWAEEQVSEERGYYKNLTANQRSGLEMSGQTIEDEQEGRSTAIKKTKKMRVKMKAVDPINFYVDDDADCVLLDEVRGVYERKVLTRGECLAMDLDPVLIANLPTYWGASSVTDNIRRNRGLRVHPVPSGEASELVEIFESYVRIDVNEDGEAELLRTFSAVNVLLKKEPADGVCYATGTAYIQPHRWTGLSMFDKLKGVQDVKTATLRQYVDNNAVGNNQRLAINADTVSLDDALNSRPGGLIRVHGLPAEHLMPLVSPDIGASAQGLLSYMDKVRSERAGAQLETQSGEPGLLSSQIGAQNVADVMTNTQLQGALIARTLAETLVRSAFMLVHKLLRTTVLDPITLRMADQWVRVDPSQWRRRERVNIKTGLSPMERKKKADTLQAVVAYQMQLLQAGLDGVMVSMPNIYSAMRDWCLSLGIEGGEKYFTDPSGQASAQAIQQKVQNQQQAQAQAEQKQAHEMQMAMDLAAAQLQLEKQKLELDKYKADEKNQFEYWKETLNAQVKEAEFTSSTYVQLQLADTEAEGRRRAEIRPGSASTDADGVG